MAGAVDCTCAGDKSAYRCNDVNNTHTVVYITTVFGPHSAPASANDLELPAPIRIQVIPESKAGKSATIVRIENANPDTLQFAAFKSEIYNLTAEA